MSEKQSDNFRSRKLDDSTSYGVCGGDIVAKGSQNQPYDNSAVTVTIKNSKSSYGDITVSMPAGDTRYDSLGSYDSSDTQFPQLSATSSVIATIIWHRREDEEPEPDEGEEE